MKKFRRITAATLMATTAVVAQAEDTGVQAEGFTPAFPRYIVNDTVEFNQNPAASVTDITIVDEKKTEVVDLVVPASFTCDGETIDYSIKAENIQLHFSDCPNLKTVTLFGIDFDTPRDHWIQGPFGGYCIDEDSFANCPNLTDIYISICRNIPLALRA